MWKSFTFMIKNDSSGLPVWQRLGAAEVAQGSSEEKIHGNNAKSILSFIKIQSKHVITGSMCFNKSALKKQRRKNSKVD